MGLQFIIDYQNNGNGFTQAVYNIISLVSGTEVTIGIVILVMLLPFRKANSFLLILYVTANTYIMVIAKIASVDPRPSWYTDAIHQLQWKCEYSYGFPSGHAQIIIILHYAIITDMIGTGPYNVFLLEPFILVILVPFSRLYLGSHSSDQIVSSMVYSFALAVLYKFKLQESLFSFLLNCKHRVKAIIGIFLLQILIMTPPIVLYEINTRGNRLGDYYLSRINSICSQSYSLKEIEARQAA